jgi:hypothetical protein
MSLFLSEVTEQITICWKIVESFFVNFCRRNTQFTLRIVVDLFCIIPVIPYFNCGQIN